MRLTRTLIFAAAFAALAFAGGTAQAQRAYPSTATPRASGTPLPMDPAWAFGFDWLLDEPMWNHDPLLAPPATASPGEAARMQSAMERRVDTMMRAANPGGPLGPMGSPLGLGMDPLDFTGMGGPLMGMPMMGAPMAGSAAASAWSHSSETDANGCTRSTSSTQTWPGGPQTSSSATGNCTGAPRARAAEPEDEDLDLDLDEEEVEEPEGRN